MPKFPVNWQWPPVPEHPTGTKFPDTPSGIPPTLLEWFDTLRLVETQHDEWFGKLNEFFDQLLQVLQLLTSTLAVKVNNELLSSTTGLTATEYGTLDTSLSQGFLVPVITGDWATPSSGEIWLNKTLHRFRGRTDNSLTRSIGFYTNLQYNFALGNAISSITVTGLSEPDTNYEILAEVSWNTTVYAPAASKTTSGFTLSFGTATPDANQRVSYGIIR